MSTNPAMTISRSLGSGGTEAGFLAARQLGWHFCDRRILRMAAEAMGKSVASLGRQEERPSGFLEQLMGLFAFGSPEAPYTPLLELPVYSRDVYEAQRKVMLQVVDHAPSVVVGRGGFVALRGRPATLHVRIHSDLEFRVRNLVTWGKAANEQAARKALALSDRNRAAFIEAISGHDWHDPAPFDLVLDLAKTGVEAAVETMVAACRQLGR